jgi:hypothetical protein
MAAYVILSRLSHDAFRNPTDFKKHADEVAGKIKSACPGVRGKIVLRQWGVLMFSILLKRTIRS